MFEHESTTMGSERVSEITDLWRVSDGTDYKPPLGLSALFLCCVHQVGLVNTNYPEYKHQVRVKWSEYEWTASPCLGASH